MKYTPGVPILLCGFSTHKASRAPVGSSSGFWEPSVCCMIFFLHFFLSLDAYFFLWWFYYEAQNVLRSYLCPCFIFSLGHAPVCLVKSVQWHNVSLSLCLLPSLSCCWTQHCAFLLVGAFFSCRINIPCDLLWLESHLKLLLITWQWICHWNTDLPFPITHLRAAITLRILLFNFI